MAHNEEKISQLKPKNEQRAVKTTTQEVKEV
jgi:hypothetical protein